MLGARADASVGKYRAVDRGVRGDDGGVYNVFVVLEYETRHVVGGNAGTVRLRETIAFHRDGVMVIEAFHRFSAFVDIDHGTTPFSVTAIVEEIVFDQHVADTAAFEPFDRIGFELDRRTAAMEVIARDLDVPLRRDQHSARTVVADDVIPDDGVCLVGEIFDDHSGKNFARDVRERQNRGIGIQYLNVRDSRKGEGLLGFTVEDLNAVTCAVNVDAAGLEMRVAYEDAVFGDFVDQGIDAVEIDGVVKLILEYAVLNRDRSAAVDEMRCVLPRGPAPAALGRDRTRADRDVRTFLCDECHSPAGVDRDVFQNDIFGI